MQIPTQYFISGTHILAQKEQKPLPAFSQSGQGLLFLFYCNCSGQDIFLSGKAEQEVSEIPPM